ncbi:MAG: hypothetical protein PHC99_11390, partial [Methylococcales bacterium]|nr:hypothetical protein [Methylococcales bacterium]
NATTDGTFILALKNQGKTLTTNALPLNISAVDLQTALTSAFAVKIDVTQGKTGEFLVSFAGDFAGQNIELLTVTTKSAVKEAILAVSQLGETTEKTVAIETSTTKQVKLVVDYSTQPLIVKTGVDSEISFDMQGEVLRASGSLDIAVAGYFLVKGDFAFEKSSQELTLSDGKKITANALTVSGVNASAFAGIGGDTPAEMGLKLGEVDFALAMFANSAAPTEHWTALKATAGSVELVGVSEVTISAQTISVEINLADATTKTVIDFNAQAVQIGDISFDFDGSKGEIIRAAGSLDIAVAGYFLVKGDFAFEKSSQELTLSDGKKITTNALTVSGINASAFAGVGGDMPAAMGLKLGKVDFALAMFANSAAPAEHWAALKATAGSVELVGVSEVTISAQTISVEINLADATTKTVIDFNAQAVQIGDISFDFDGSKGEIIRASGSLDIAVAGYFLVKGDFAFEKSSQELTLSDGKKITADALTVSGINASAFAGIGCDTPAEMGLKLGEVDFALAMFANSAAPTEHWTALKATAGSVELVGVSEVTISAQTISVEINLADATTKTVIDFNAQAVQIGDISFDFDGSKGEIIRAAGSLDIAVAGYFLVKGDFAFEKSSQELTLSDGKKITTNALTVSGINASAFAGVGGDTPAAMGLKLGKVDFALAMFANSAAPAEHWTALKATAGSVELVGVSEVTISAQTISVEINLADATTKTVLDFKEKALQIGDISFDFDGSKGEIIRASGSLDIAVAGYFLVKGDFAFEKSSQELTLSDGKKIIANALTVSGINASAFAGIGGDTAAEMGLKLGKVDFALAMFANSAAPAEHWTALKATAGSVELVGVSEVTISAQTISVEVNLADATTKTVIDFNAQALQIGDISFDFDGSKGEIIRAAGELSINVANFFAVNGKFSFEKSTEKLTLSDGKTVDANALKLGATGVSAFAGLNGDSENPLGFVLDDVDFGLALLSDSQNAARRWTALQANAKSVAFVGIDDVSIAGKTLNLAINTADSEGLVVDFAKQNLNIATSSSSGITLDMDGKQGKLLRATGEFDLNLANFFSVSGSFAFEKSTREVTLSDQSKVQTDAITFGGSNLDAFAGLNGNSDAKMGFELADVNFGLALLSEQKNTERQWVSLQATAEKVGFVGIDGFTVSAKKLALNYNQADEKGIVVDYAAQPFEIATGSENASITLDMDGLKGALIQAVGQLDINVLDFFQVSGEFAFEKSTQEVTLSDQSKITTDLLTVGGHNVSAFAGLNGNSDAKMGLEVKNIDFALALLTDQKDVQRRWLSLKTNAGAAAFIGVEGLTVAANNLFVEVNQSIGKDSDVTVSATGQKIVTEKTNTILKLDVTDSAGEIEFSYKNQSATVNLNQSDKLLVSQIKLKFESFAGIGQGNVKVSGTKTAGFNIEFIGELAGQPIENVEIKTIAPDISVDISEQKTGETHVETTQNGQDANEKQVLIFNGLQAGKGSFTLTFEGKTTADIAFAGSDSAKNAQNIQTALETLANIGAGNVIVSVAKDFSINRQRYSIEFAGKLARKNVGALSVNPKNLTITTFETGTATTATNEQQEIRYQATGRNTNGSLVAGSGTFTLSLDGQKTVPIRIAESSFTTNITEIKGALEKLDGVGTGNVLVEVTQKTGTNQIYKISFINKLANKNIGLLKIEDISSLKGTDVIISGIKDGSSGVAQTNEISTPIADVQTASVTVETTQDAVAAEIIENTIKNNEIQRIKINATTDGTFILALKNQGKTLTTNALPLNISAVDLQTALTSAFATKMDVSQSKTGEFLVSFAGDFAGQNVELLTVTTKSAVKEAILAVSQLGETTEKTVAVETSTTKQVKLVVDYSTQPLVVKTGVESAITFDMKGEVLRASGSLDIAVAGYF